MTTEVSKKAGFKKKSKEDKSSTSFSFRGNFEHNLDTKGRVSLPSYFRKILQNLNQNSIVITNYISDGMRCLEGFGIDSWVEFENKLKEKSRFSSKLQKLENFYLSRATECNIDASGRILIPSYLRDYASINKNITFTSSIHGFRVWDTRVWNTVFNDAEQALINDPDLFSEVDL